MTRQRTRRPGSVPAAPSESAAEIVERLQARFACGKGLVAVPDTWLVHLAELDRNLAALDPNYELAQVKVKFGTLRYYIESPLGKPLPCCVRFEREHPYPTQPADGDPIPQLELDNAIAHWDDELEVHDAGAEHRLAQRVRDETEERMAVLIAYAERRSMYWNS